MTGNSATRNILENAKSESFVELNTNSKNELLNSLFKNIVLYTNNIVSFADGNSEGEYILIASSDVVKILKEHYSWNAISYSCLPKNFSYTPSGTLSNKWHLLCDPLLKNDSLILGILDKVDDVNVLKDKVYVLKFEELNLNFTKD